MLINCSRGVPPLSRKGADLNRAAVFPKHRMRGRMPSNSLVAGTRNTDDLTIVIDRGGGPGGVSRNERERVDFIWRSESPHGWAKLENSGAATRWIMNAILSPSHYLTEVVSSSCEAVISAREIRQSTHLPLLPNESEVDIADVVRRTV